MDFATRRYGNTKSVPDAAVNAWQQLGHSVYQDNPSRSGSLLLHRPALGRSQSVSTCTHKLEII